MIKKYDAYKDSGVQWIGEIPTSWFNDRLGTILEPISKKGNADKPLLSITREKGVILRDVEDDSENHNFIPDDLSNYKLIEKGQFGMNKMKAWQGSYGVSSHTGIVSPAYYVFKFIKPIYPEFFHWAIRSKTYISFFGSASDGVRIGQWDLSKDRMKNIPFVFPDVDSQKKIVEFIQDKAEQIDQAIAIKEQQIVLLNERKQIVIQKAVTQGLNPNVATKDSGVEWIGQIPEHWKCVKLKYFIDLIPGYAFKSEEYSSNDKDIKLLRGINVSPNQIKWSETVYWPSEKVDMYEEYLLQEGDIVIAMDRPWVSGGIRIAEIGKHDLPALLLQRVARMRSKVGISNKYLKILLTNDLFLAYFTPMLTGISVPHISGDQIENFICPLPSIDEQNQIIQYLEHNLSEIKKAKELLLTQIEKLKEYKTTLINDAVTGKIKVA